MLVIAGELVIPIKRWTNVVVGVAVGVDGEDGEEEEEESPGAAVEEGGDGWGEAALVHHLHQPTEKRWKRGRHQKRERGTCMGESVFGLTTC